MNSKSDLKLLKKKKESLCSINLLEKKKFFKEKKEKKRFLKKKVKVKESSSLYVGDLSVFVKENDLINIFSKIGKVSSVKICRDFSTRLSLGYSYVNFSTPKEAQKAYKLLNHYTDATLGYKPLRIMWIQKNKFLRFSGIGNLFVKDLPLYFNNKTLMELFSKYGKILSCKVVLDEEKRSMGYGFVHYQKEENSKIAIEKINNCVIDGKKLFVGPFIPKKKRSQKSFSKSLFTNLYIKNILPENCTEIYIKDLFEIFGQITSVFIPRINGSPLGFAFVNFRNPEDAEDAVFKMNKKQIKKKALYVGKAETKIERQRRLRKKFLEKKMNKVLFFPRLILVIVNIPIFLKRKILIFNYIKIGAFKRFKMLSKKKNLPLKFAFLCFDKKKILNQSIKSRNFFLKKNKIILRFPQNLFFENYAFVKKINSQVHRRIRGVEEKTILKFFSFYFSKMKGRYLKCCWLKAYIKNIISMYNTLKNIFSRIFKGYRKKIYPIHEARYFIEYFVPQIIYRKKKFFFAHYFFCPQCWIKKLKVSWTKSKYEWNFVFADTAVGIKREAFAYFIFKIPRIKISKILTSKKFLGF